MEQIFLNIYFDIQNIQIEDKVLLDKNLKDIFLNKWLYIILINCTPNNKLILDKIYELANTYGVKISLKIDKNIEILKLIEYNYINTEYVIFENIDDLKKYSNDLKKFGIRSIYFQDIKEEKEYTSEIKLSKILTKS